jgi:hypothetical protein
VRRDLPPLARLAAFLAWEELLARHQDLSQLAIDFDMEADRPGSGSANEHAVA